MDLAESFLCYNEESDFHQKWRIERDIMLWKLMRVLFHGYIKSFIAMFKKYFQICRKMAMEEKNL